MNELCTRSDYSSDLVKLDNNEIRQKFQFID